MDELLRDYRDTASDLLAGIRDKLDALAQRPHDQGLLNDIHRALHTIRGGADLLGLSELTRPCDLLENLFDRLRHRELVLNGSMRDCVVANLAMVGRMLAALADGGTLPQADDDLVAGLAAVMPAPTDSRPVTAPAEPEAMRAGHSSPAGRRKSDRGGLAALPLGGRRTTDANADRLVAVEAVRLARVRELGAALCRAWSASSPTAQSEASLARLAPRVVAFRAALSLLERQPLALLFGRLRRSVRDRAAACGKQVVITTTGDAIELDALAVAAVSDWLMMWLNHAIEHDIGTVPQRQAAGLPAAARIAIVARQSGDRLCLNVTHDGRGGQPVNDSAVQARIETLGGTLEVSSANGQETTCAITLPLTLTTLPVLVAEAGGLTVAWSLESVGKVIRLSQHDDAKIPVIALAQRLGRATNAAATYGVHIERDNATPCLLAVGTLPQRHDAVVRAPNEPCQPGVVGTLDLPDGRTAHLLDLAVLLATTPIAETAE